MFSGRFEYAIDDKGRLSIPAKFRESLISHMEPAEGQRVASYYGKQGGRKKEAAVAEAEADTDEP